VYWQTLGVIYERVTSIWDVKYEFIAPFSSLPFEFRENSESTNPLYFIYCSHILNHHYFDVCDHCYKQRNNVCNNGNTPDGRESAKSNSSISL
jgi:hypothetical protein